MSKIPNAKFPDPAPEFNISLKARLTADFDKYSNGTVQMTMHGGDVQMNGKEIGRVAHAIPCGVSVQIGKRNYYVDFKDLFEAVYEAETANGNIPKNV